LDRAPPGHSLKFAQAPPLEALAMGAPGFATPPAFEKATPNQEAVARAQAESLHARGYMVENTFISFIEPVGICARRCASAPPRSSFRNSIPHRCGLGAGQSEQTVEHNQTLTLRCKASDEAARRSLDSGRYCPCPSLSEGGNSDRVSRTTVECNASSADHLISDDRALAVENELVVSACSSDASTAAPPPLWELIKQEFRWLRIEGYVLHEGPWRSGKTKNCCHGDAKGLRILVQGLPTSKRARWVRPMMWMLASVLRRCGCHAVVNSLGLLVQCPVTGCPFIVEFSAARGLSRACPTVELSAERGGLWSESDK